VHTAHGADSRLASARYFAASAVEVYAVMPRCSPARVPNARGVGARFASRRYFSTSLPFRGPSFIRN